MTDFLLELLSEEIPARMQEKAAADLRWAFETEVRKAGLFQRKTEVFYTPRRLALIARGMSIATELEVEEFKGPKVGAPEQAITGFLKKTGATREELFEQPDGKGVPTLFVQKQKLSRSAEDVLADVIPTIVRGFPWPKAMRWGAASLSPESPRWVRPLQGIVALFGEAIVPVEIAGVASGAATVGHRFHHPGVITIGSADDYAEKLRACHVIVDAEERRHIVREGAEAAAATAGLTLVPDAGLVAENAGLTEWPVPLLGHFDPAFLAVPREVIQLTMRTNQKYFACTDASGALAPAFVCTANIDASDGGAAIVAGNAKVLAARLSDARFFWEQDLKVPLAERAKKLSDIVFHEKLGTVADKVERVAKLARWLVEEGIVTSKPLPFRGGVGVGPHSTEPAPGEAPHPPTPSPEGEGERAALADMAEQAARLAKADLVTGMVGEFPELQGVMGGYYARAEGYPDAVADAIRDHYKPVGQGDDVPTALVTVAVSLADKLDTIASFFLIRQQPTGSRDPFALRRAALGVLAQLQGVGVRLPLTQVLEQAVYPVLAQINAKITALSTTMASQTALANEMLSTIDDDTASAYDKAALREAFPYKERPVIDPIAEDVEALISAGGFDGFAEGVINFFADRLKVQQREAGVRHDLIDAVFALGGEDDLVRLLARVKALQAFVETGEGANLLAGYRRAANILRAEAKKGEAIDPSRHPELVSGSPAPQATEPDAGGMLKRVQHDEEGGAPFVFPYDPDPAELALADALDRQLPRAEQAIAAEDFAAAMTALSVLRPAIDQFFDDVTVNADEPAKRTARLALLAKLVAAMHKVADFSKIEG